MKGRHLGGFCNSDSENGYAPYVVVADSDEAYGCHSSSPGAGGDSVEVVPLLTVPP